MNKLPVLMVKRLVDTQQPIPPSGYFVSGLNKEGTSFREGLDSRADAEELYARLVASERYFFLQLTSASGYVYASHYSVTD